MASSFNLPTLQGPILCKSRFLGQTNFSNFLTHKSSLQTPKQSSIITTAKFNLFEILGGRGLCNGEAGLQKELQKSVTPPQESSENSPNSPEKSTPSEIESIPESGFDKELLGLTGGFPGGEKGLRKFIEQNPPPPPPKKTETQNLTTSGLNQSLTRKPKPPELPLLMPGMIAIVKNPNSPYHMYCGIVQRITDGKAGVLFEGGNWDRLITFRLAELERREKGPPMVSPRSCVLELQAMPEQKS